MEAHLLHNVNLAIVGPGCEFDRHHPESWPRALALRQVDAALNVAVFPALTYFCIDSARINLVVFLQASDVKTAVFDLSNQSAATRFVVDVILQFLVHPTAAFHLVNPVGGVQLRAVELIVPNKRISVRHIIGGAIHSCLCYSD